MTTRLRIGVVGFGYWGPNLVRNFTNCAQTRVVAVADANPARRELVGVQYPWIRTVAGTEELMRDPEIDAIVLATPLHTHVSLARAALAAGKHVLVEKPLAPTVAECLELSTLAKERGVVLMVDHTFVYTGAVRKIRQLLDDGELGRVLYFDSVRINLGLFRPNYNVIWDLAPHDLSIMDHVLQAKPTWVSAIGANHYGPQANLAYVTVGFENNLLAHMHVNWVAPIKTRRITIAGTRRMLVWDDTSPVEPVKIYESSVDVEGMDLEQAYHLNVQYRTGDVLVPKLDGVEALSRLASTFAAACLEGKPSPTDADAGSRVVRLLSAADESLTHQGARIEL